MDAAISRIRDMRRAPPCACCALARGEPILREQEKIRIDIGDAGQSALVLGFAAGRFPNGRCGKRATQFAHRAGTEREGRVLRNGHRHVRCESGARERAGRDRRDGGPELALSHPAPLWSEQDPDAG